MAGTVNYNVSRERETCPSHTALRDALSLTSFISIPVASGGPPRDGAVEALDLRRHWSRSKGFVNTSDRESTPLSPWSSPPPPSPTSGPGSEALPRKLLMKPTRPSFRPWTLPKRLKSTLVKTHQQTRRTTPASTRPTESFAHSLLLYSNASRPKATKNDIMLSVNDIRPTNQDNHRVITTHAQSNSEYGRL